MLELFCGHFLIVIFLWEASIMMGNILEYFLILADTFSGLIKFSHFSKRFKKISGLNKNLFSSFKKL
jgi:hypothetical protein